MQTRQLGSNRPAPVCCVGRSEVAISDLDSGSVMLRRCGRKGERSAPWAAAPTSLTRYYGAMATRQGPLYCRLARFSDAALAHGGTTILDGNRTRKSIVTHYTSLEAYPPAHMKPGALKEGHFLLENGGYVFDLPWIQDNVRKLGSQKLGRRTPLGASC